MLVPVITSVISSKSAEFQTNRTGFLLFVLYPSQFSCLFF